MIKGKARNVCSGLIRHNVASQLREKIEERKLPIELICLANDTVGAMITSAYNDPETIIGAFFGTGCNAAYMEHLSNKSIPKIQLSDEDWETAKKGGWKMAINCEYGAFDNAKRILPRTKYDEQIGKESPRPGEKNFENSLRACIWARFSDLTSWISYIRGGWYSGDSKVEGEICD
ncbi:actin-like ATPase domain-containing protein [Zopfia rhizophila CBS 207.26]|uniref:Phosphotransferase n=1 Tax=Zopfia rhizophila CBS 207.26 TaxID=1314779 RepID=A0A6A6DF53_9PEZI|nr:actin-like ATPase domain-containing protein [Zopfia rhizophila CBS 207.26]